MNFVLNRNRVVASVHGHAIRFEKGVPTHVPPECYQEIIAIGGVPETEIEEPVVPENTRPSDPFAMKKAVFKVFEDIKLRNQREDFTAGGLPHPKALERELGWKVDAKERDALWAEFMKAED